MNDYAYNDILHLINMRDTWELNSIITTRFLLRRRMSKKMRLKYLSKLQLLNKLLTKFKYAYRILKAYEKKVLELDYRFRHLKQRKMKLITKEIKFTSEIHSKKIQHNNKAFKKILKKKYDFYEGNLGQLGLSRVNQERNVSRNYTKELLLIIIIKNNCSFFFVI